MDQQLKEKGKEQEMSPTVYGPLKALRHENTTGNIKSSNRSDGEAVCVIRA